MHKMTRSEEYRGLEAKFKATAILYARLMEEIKWRIGVTQYAAAGAYRTPPLAAFEICYLELRKICEVFALACLTAHGDIPGVRTKLMQKTYDADRIIKQLSELHTDFYPKPGKQRVDPVTKRPVEILPVESGFLTKQELLHLYGDCGNYLHRGSIRQLLTKWNPTLDFEKIRAWVDKFVKLLNHHQIQLSNPDLMMVVLMNGKDTGRVQCTLTKRIGVVADLERLRAEYQATLAPDGSIQSPVQNPV